MVEVNYSEISCKINRLDNEFLSIDDVCLLLKDIFRYVNDDRKDVFIRSLITKLSASIIKVIYNGALSFDYYKSYVSQFRQFFIETSSYEEAVVDKYFDDCFLSDDYITFFLSIKQCFIDDDLVDVERLAKESNLSVMRWLDEKIGALGIESKNLASTIASIKSELRRRKTLSKDELESIISICDAGVSPEYIDEVNKELAFINEYSNKDTSELMIVFKKLYNELKSSYLNRREEADKKLLCRFICSELYRRTYGLEGKKTSVGKSEFFGISSKKLKFDLSSYHSKLSRVDSEVSKYKKKRELFKSRKILKGFLDNFKSKENNNTVICDGFDDGYSKGAEVIPIAEVKIEKRTDLLHKSLAVVCGFGFGFAMSSCPGIGLFRMTLSGIKLSYSVVKKMFPDSFISNFSDIICSKFESKWNSFSVKNHRITAFIGNINRRYGKAVSKKIVDCFVNSLASGYLIGNLFELLTMSGNFFGAIFDKFGEFELDSVVDNSPAPTFQSDFISGDNLTKSSISKVKCLNRGRLPNPFRSSHEVVIDNFASFGEIVEDTVTTARDCLYNIGDVINVEGIEYGYVSSDSLNPLRLNTGKVVEAIIEKIVELPDGKVRVHLKQLNGDGFAWVDKAVLDSLEKAVGLGR